MNYNTSDTGFHVCFVGIYLPYLSKWSIHIVQSTHQLMSQKLTLVSASHSYD